MQWHLKTSALEQIATSTDVKECFTEITHFFLHKSLKIILNNQDPWILITSEFTKNETHGLMYYIFMRTLRFSGGHCRLIQNSYYFTSSRRTRLNTIEIQHMESLSYTFNHSNCPLVSHNSSEEYDCVQTDSNNRIKF